MIQLRPIVLALAAWPAVTAAASERISIIDAHSQVDHLVDLGQIVPLMDKGGVARVILSARGRLRPDDIAALGARHPSRITLAARSKGRAYAENRPGYYKLLRKQAAMPGFQSMAEVLIWHARKGAKAPEWNIPIDAPQAQAALGLAIARGWPFIPHIEFAAPGTNRRRLMADLETLLDTYPTHPIALIHMGQLDATAARKLIATHPNIYFLTSHANPVATAKSRQPWTDMFAADRLASDWRSLVTAHPERFVLAFDNVFAEHWGAFYLDQIALWRHALAELPDSVANAIAHGNAERLWNLPPATRTRR